MMYVSAAVSRLSRWRCNVYLRAVRLYLGGSATYILTAVSFIHMCEGLVFVCSILLNMQCCDNNCGNFTQYFMSYIFSVL